MFLNYKTLDLHVNKCVMCRSITFEDQKTDLKQEIKASSFLKIRKP